MKVIRLVDVYQDSGAEGILYSLLAEREKEDDPFIPRAQRRLPDRAEFNNYFTSHPYQTWLLAKEHDIAIGVVTISHKGDIGVVLFTQYRSRGYGKKILEQVLNTEAPPALKNFKATIHRHNFRSIRLFEAAGFVHTENVYERK